MSPGTLLDVRPGSLFLVSHARGAVSIPSEELPARIHELPPTSVGLRIVDCTGSAARKAAEFLRQRGYVVEIVCVSPEDQTEAGPCRSYLWQPNPFLVEALERIGPAPAGATALDLACGSGRDAVYLAMHGYRVTAVDVLPDALDRANDLARRCGVELRTIQQNLESGAPLPNGPFDLVTVFRYLHRPLFPAIRQAVGCGGYLAYETFHQRTLETGRPPRNPVHLLTTGELEREFAEFEILIARDAVEREGRYISSLLAEKRQDR